MHDGWCWRRLSISGLGQSRISCLHCYTLLFTHTTHYTSRGEQNNFMVAEDSPHRHFSLAHTATFSPSTHHLSHSFTRMHTSRHLNTIPTHIPSTICSHTVIYTIAVTLHGHTLLLAVLRRYDSIPVASILSLTSAFAPAGSLPTIRPRGIRYSFAIHTHPNVVVLFDRVWRWPNALRRVEVHDSPHAIV